VSRMSQVPPSGPGTIRAAFMFFLRFIGAQAPARQGGAQRRRPKTIGRRDRLAAA
jgi:hypothetical protein